MYIQPNQQHIYLKMMILVIKYFLLYIILTRHCDVTISFIVLNFLHFLKQY